LQEEIELHFTPQGTVLIRVCSACFAGEQDAACSSSAVQFVRDLVAEGHVSSITEPDKDPEEEDGQGIVSPARQAQGGQG